MFSVGRSSFHTISRRDPQFIFAILTPPFCHAATAMSGYIAKAVIDGTTYSLIV
jgi:hypothetical protein